MSDFIEVNKPASPSLIDGVIVPEKDGVFAISATARHASNNHATPSMRLEITINGTLDYASKTLGWQDGPSEQQGVTTEFLRAGQQYTIEARSFNSNADATGISLSAKRV